MTSKKWLHGPQSLAFLSSLVFSRLHFKEKMGNFLWWYHLSYLVWLGHFKPQNHSKMDVNSFKWGYSKFCWSCPNHSVLKSCFFLFLPSRGWGPVCLLGFLPSVNSAFLQLLAPRASVPWSFLTAGIRGHGHLSQL